VKKWNDREYNIIEWVITYISEMSVEEKYRIALRNLKREPMSQIADYGIEEREALIAAITYFEDLYKYSVNGCPNGNKTVRNVLFRLQLLSSAKKKLTESLSAE